MAALGQQLHRLLPFSGLLNGVERGKRRIETMLRERRRIDCEVNAG